MAEKRRKKRGGKKRNRSRVSSGDGPGHRAGKHQRSAQRQTGNVSAIGAAEKQKSAWVKIEYRDADGNLTFPKKTIASTYSRRYEEVPENAEINVHVLTGYKPRALMLVERKIYPIHTHSVRGWRRRGQVRVEMEGWRQHEAEWFEAMRGVTLAISDPGMPGPHNEESNYIVSESSFGRKIVEVINHEGSAKETKLYEGTLDIKETWKSVWHRQRVDVLNLGFKLLFVPLFVALGSGITLLWIDRSPSTDSQSMELRESPAVNDQQLVDESENEQLERNVSEGGSDEDPVETVSQPNDAGEGGVQSRRGPADIDSE